MSIDDLLVVLCLNPSDYKTITYTDEGDYYSLSLETQNGTCFAIDVLKDLIVG